MTRTLATAGLFLGTLLACGASMRPIPDDVEPVPTERTSARLADAGGIAIAIADAGGRYVATAHPSRPIACADTRHRPLAVRQVAPDRWIIASGVVDVVRSERKVIVTPQVDSAGRVLGLAIQDIGADSCLGALGFRDGDLVRSINSFPLEGDWSTFPAISASISKNGAAVIRFVRDGQARTWLYEVKTE